MAGPVPVAGRHADRCDGHPVRLDVVGVAVEAVLVVGDQHLRADIQDDLGQLRRGRGHVGLPEAVRAVVAGQAHHPRVAPPAGPAEESLVTDAQRGARGGQFGDPVLPEAVAVGGQVGQFGRDDLTKLAPRAGDQGDLGTFGGVPGDGGPGADRLVVGMGVHQKQAAGAVLAVHAVRLARRHGQGPVTKERGRRPPGGSRGVAPPGQHGQGPVTKERGRRPPGGSRGVAPPGQGQGPVTKERGRRPPGSRGSLPRASTMAG